MSDETKPHDSRIIDQFTRQAIPFAQLPAHLSAVEVLLELAVPTAADEVLDVACGPGLVACELAPRVRYCEGLDITPAMLEEARRRQAAAGLTNLSWRLGTADPLPYADDSFSLVLTRYSFHHLLEPQRVFAEMLRVCRPGGRVLVADVVQPETKAAAFDRMERTRDPSHTQALRAGQLERWFLAAGLADCRRVEYPVTVELESQLRVSFPEPGGLERLREMIRADVGHDDLGVAACRKGDGVWFSYPIQVCVGRKLRA